MLNIAKLIRDRMIMQNLADNTALSIATHKARTMNFVGACNYMIGFFLRMGTRGEFVQMSTYGTNMVASFPFGDWQPGSNSALSSGVSGLKTTVDVIQKAQEAAMVFHLWYMGTVYKDLLAKGYFPIIMPFPIEIKDLDFAEITDPSGKIVEIAERHFGLKRNRKGITYKKTENVSVKTVSYVYTKMLGLELKKIFMEQIKKIPLVGRFAGTVDELWDKLAEELNLSDYTDAPTYAKKEYSWYIMADNFKDQKMQIALIKRNNGSNKPLFSRWLGISYPDMMAFSASAIYNTKDNNKSHNEYRVKTTGIMFPEKESELLGALSPAAELLLLGPTVAQTIILDAQLADIPVVGWIALIVVPAYIAANKGMMQKMIYDGIPDSPINNYADARKFGWGAHLVPYRTE